MHDLRYAVRQLAKSPGFSVIAVLTLAVGIGASTAMFSALRALVIEPFSFPHSERIVHVWSNEGQPLSQPDFFDVLDRATSFAELGAYSPTPANLGGDRPQAVRSVSCTPGVLRAFGIAPALGRLLDAKDEKSGAPLVAVISYSLWRQSFAADPALVGRTIRINGGNATVVGIMPAQFEFASPWMRTETCQMWVPLQLKRGEGDRGSHWLCTVGRLKPGVMIATADAEVKAVAAQLKQDHPDTNSQKPFLVRSLHLEMTRYIGLRVWMLFGAVTLVLLIACANVASMLLARSARRQGEIGVRLALGATRTQIVRLALTESLVLAALGAFGGLLIALYGVGILAAIAPVSDARRAAMTLNGGVLVFASGITFLTALLAGLPSAVAAMRFSVVDLLRTDSRSATGSRTRHHTLRALIVGQVAIAFVLANGAALFSAGYLKLMAANRSLATEYVLSALLQLRGDRYAKTESRVQFWNQLAERAATLPGVTAAGLTTKLPLEGGSNMWILVNNEVFDPTAGGRLAEMSAITPGYFNAAGIALLRGRTLEPGDAGEDAIGVVVNRALAEKCWPGEDPLGKIIRPSGPHPWFHAHVVGVVESVRQWGAETPPNPEIYWTPEHAWGQGVFLVVRSAQPAARLTPALRRAVAALDPDLPLAEVRTLQDVVDDAVKGESAIAGLVDFFMATALGLVAVGLYGTLSYHVLQRTREIGIRLALGASRREVVRLVFRQGSGWVLTGVLLGIAGALLLTSALRALVYGLDSADPFGLLLATAAVAAAAALACWIPARRASRVDPIVALRAE
jgi:predicted permease